MTERELKLLLNANRLGILTKEKIMGVKKTLIPLLFTWLFLFSVMAAAEVVHIDKMGNVEVIPDGYFLGVDKSSEILIQPGFDRMEKSNREPLNFDDGLYIREKSSDKDSN